MKCILITVILLAFCSTSVLAQSKKLVWQPGTIVSNKYESNIKTFEYTYTDISKSVTDSTRDEKKTLAVRDDRENVRIKTAEGTYILSRDLKFIWHKKLKLKEGDIVQIAEKDKFVYVKTAKGKKFKYSLVGIEPVKNENDNQ